MFSFKRLEIVIRVFLTTVMLLNALACSPQTTSRVSGSAGESIINPKAARTLPEQKPVYYDPPQITYPQQTSPEASKVEAPVPPKGQVEFAITADPAVVPANGVVTLHVFVRNHSNHELNSLVFNDSLETGLEYQQDGKSPVTYDPKKKQVTLKIDRVGAGEEFTFHYSIMVTSSKRSAIQGKVWLHSAELVSRESKVNLKTSVALGNALTIANAQSQFVLLDPQGGWNDLGRVSVNMPKENVGENALIMSTPTRVEGKGPDLQFELDMFETSALSMDAANELDEQAVSLKKGSEAAFKEPAFLEINLDQYIDLANVPAGQEPYVATYDETSKVWVKVPIVETDVQGNSVTVEAAHFSTWGAGLGSSLPQNGANVLLFDQPYTSLFTGSARYSIPVWTPPGRGGMQPDISLSYSSGTVDGVLGDVQAPWVGVGWNIDDVEIVREITTDENGYGYRDEYALTLNGSLYELKRDDFHPYRYFTERAAFLYIERHNAPSGSPSEDNTTGEWWEVVTTDGTRYRLGWNEDSEQLALMYGYSCTTVGSTCWPDGAYASLGYAGEAKNLVAMRWRVDRVSDTHGNYMEYNYFKTQPDPSTTLAPFDRESYLQSIEYTGFDDPDPTDGITPHLEPAYQIVFDYGNRSSIGDVPTEYHIWDNVDTRYLNSIWSCYGECAANGSNAIRKYQFGYSLANVPNANGTLTLTSLDITGGGYTENGQFIPPTHAPTIRFTYQDKDNRASGNGDVFRYPRLVSIDNGSGGLLTFNYEHDGRGNNSWYNYRVQNVAVDSGMGLARKQSYSYVTPMYSGSGGDPALGDLIGYTTVTESLLDFLNGDAVTLKTRHTFGAAGLDIGREIQTEWLSDSDTVLRKTTNTYVTDNIGAPKNKDGIPLPNWNYRYLLEAADYERSAGTLVQTSKTRYYNDPYTGNLLVQSTYTGNNLYRKTYYEYVQNPNPAHYLLNKVSRILLVDAANQIYSDTRYHYDGGINQIPTRGHLTLVQKLTGNGDQTIDTVMGYDTPDGSANYGNVTSVRAYRNYGTVNLYPPAAPQSLFWESKSEYDALTQTYPVTVTNALEQSSSSAYLYTLGVPYQSTDLNDWTTSTTYDGLGRTLSTTPPGLQQPGVWYVYPSPDANGRISAPHSVEMQILDTIAGQYRSVWGIYDGAGRMLQTQVDAGDKLLVNTSLFNAQGLAIQQSLPYEVNGAGGNYIYNSGNQFTTMEYDALGRATSITSPGDIITETSYDGLTTTVLDPNGNKTSSTTDGLGRMISVAEFSDASTVYATTTYSYDAADHLIQVKDAKLTTTTIQYDWLGRKLSMDDPDMGLWSYGYDALGNMTSQTDAGGQVLTFAYDALNRLATKSAGSTTLSTYTYGTEPGTVGLRIGMTDQSGSSIWEYPVEYFGRTVKETRTIGQEPQAETHSIETHTDWLGRAIKTIYDNDEVVSYTYDDLGRPDQLESNKEENTLVNLAYNVLGQIETQALGNGTVITNTYDANTTRLANRKAEHGSTVQLDLSYEYDLNGNITKLIDQRSNGAVETQFYEYDFLNRLTSAIGATGTPEAAPVDPQTYGQQFEYDKVGNIQQINNWGVPPTQQQGRAPSDNFGFASYDVPQAPDKALLAPVYQEEPTLTATQTETPTSTATPSPTETLSQAGTATKSPTVTNTPVPTNTFAGISTPSATPPTSTPVPNNANTVALLHMDGRDRAKTFKDQTGKVWTAVGNAQIDTAQSKFGGASALFDGNGDYITTSDSDQFYLSNLDWTIDFWVRFDSGTSGGRNLVSQYQDANNWMDIWLDANWTRLTFSQKSGGTTATQFYTDVPFTTDTWYHIAIMRNGNTPLIAVDGVQQVVTQQTSISGKSLSNLSGPLAIGAWNASGFMKGWIDEFRFSKGIALWTSNFTPPGSEHGFVTSTPTSTATYTPTATPTLVPVMDDSYIVSLVHMNGADASTTFTDADESNRTWTAAGDAQIDTAQAKFGGASALFDGNGDYITTSDSDQFYLSNLDWTIDFWVRFDSGTSGARNLVSQYQDANNWMDVWLDANWTRLNFCQVSNGVATAQFYTEMPFTTDTWYHISIMRNGNTPLIAVDGVQQPVTQATSIAGKSFANLSGPLAIGAWNANGSLKGWVDEFRFSKGIARWTSDFVPPASEYAFGTMDERLMAYWNFEAVTITPTSDTKLFGDPAYFNNAVTLQNETTIISDGASGAGLAFDGVNDYAVVADHSDIRQNGSFTLSAWINPSVVETYHTQYIVNKGISATDFDYGFITTSTNGTATPTSTATSANTSTPLAPENVDTNGKLLFRVGDLTPNKVIGPVLPINTWTLVTGVYDHSQGELRLYINGALSAIEKVTGTVSMGTGPLKFGSDTYPYYGKLDEVRFYNRALTDQEISQQLLGTFATPTPITPSPAPVIVPVGAGLYEDTHSAWTYSGTWTAWAGAGTPYTSHYTARIGNSAELTFTGTRFALDYVKHPQYGLIDVYVDGVKIDTINSYNATLLRDQTYTSPMYSAGTHTVRFVYASGGSYIDLDAIHIFDTPLTPVGAGTYDDAHSAWNYAGNWTAWIGTGRFDNTSHYTGTAGDFAELSFTGTRFTLNYVKNSSYGSIDVFVDGARIDTINSYNATTLFNQTYTSPAYSSGTHTVRLVYTGGRNYIEIDAIQIYDTLPTPIGAGTYDDAHSAWTYSGTWTAWAGNGPYYNTSHYTTKVGDFAEVTFTGTQFILTYVKSSTYGLIDVYVDGNKIDTLNTYNATTLYNQTYTSPVYSAGNHTARFVYVSTRTYIDIDAIQIFDTPNATSTPLGLSVGAGTYDDTHIAWKYSGTWTTWTGDGPYNSTSHYTNVIGSSAELTFTGTRFTLTYVKNSTYGLIDVYMDGNKIDTIDTHATSNVYQRTYTSPIYQAGTHTVRLVYVSGGTYIDLDAIQIYDTPPTPVGAGLYEDTHGAWTYSGVWTAWGGGATPYTTHYTTRVGDFAEVTFTGTRFALDYVKDANYGLIDVYVDGVKIDTINTYNATLLRNQTYTSPVYSAGTHTVRFVYGGARTYIDIDAIQIFDTAGATSTPIAMPVGVGTYDDTHIVWKYSGAWIPWTNTGPANGTIHYTRTVGDYAEFPFNGTQFTLTYTKDPTYGLIDVYVDGNKVGTINANNANVLWQQTWTSPVYATGNHTVRFVYASGGTYIDIDAIQILNPAPPTATSVPPGWHASDYTYSTGIVHAVTAVNRGVTPVDTFTYDQNGNMTCRVEGGVTYKQEYNAENRISAIHKMDGDCQTGTSVESWSYVYDGDGVRTTTSHDTGSGPVITRYYFGGAYETTGSAWKKYYSFGGTTLMRDSSQPTELKYFLSDHLGSTSVVLSPDGDDPDTEIDVEQQRYLPFGGVRTDLADPPYRITSTDFTYTGQRNLEGTGLMDYRARFYSPALGRFIQPDSIIPGVANPQSWNRFSYVTNNPVRYTDPTGHRLVEDEFGGGCSTSGYCGGSSDYTPSKDEGDDDDDDGGLPDANPGDASNSQILIAFADINEDGVPSKGMMGVGTVIHVGNGYSTIVTATHLQVYSPFFWYQTADGFHRLNRMDVQTFPYGFTDVMFINIPVELPEEFIPAEIAHPTFHGGENISVGYYDEESHSLEVFETQVRDDPNKPGQYSGAGIAFNNPGNLLKPGDSGGGVFYDGYLVGVNSYHWDDELGPYIVFPQIPPEQ